MLRTPSGESAKLDIEAEAPSYGFSGRPLSPIIGSQPSSPAVERNTLTQGNALGLKSLLQPAIATIQSEEGASKLAPSRPSLGQRGLSIVEHLLTKGTGTSAAATPKPTPAALELGQNPFEAAAAAGLAAAPAVPSTPSLQASIAAKRPLANRLLSEGHPISGLSASRGASGPCIKKLLDDLEGSAADKSYGSNKDSASMRSSILPKDSTDHRGTGNGSIISSTSSAVSPLTPRKRSSSITMGGQQTGPSISRTFSRSGGKRESHRRRSSAASTSALHADLTLSAYSQSTSVDSAASCSGLPYFCLESNPHGNGGLQNAVRSVADAHIRTSSDPVQPTFSRSGSDRDRSRPASVDNVGEAEPEKPVRATHVQKLPAIGGSVTDYKWIGTIGCGISDFEDPLRAAVEKRYADEKRSAVVWVEDDVLEPAYDNFCKQVRYSFVARRAR